jgi:L-iditol 2-dehydrogenase
LIGTADDAAARLPAARRLGLAAADIGEIPLPQAVTEAFSGEKPDAWVEAAGSVKALEAALNHTKPGGHVSVVGIYGDTLPWSPTGAVRAGLTVHFRYASDYAAYREAADFFHRHVETLGPLADLQPLSAAETAFAAAEKRKQVKIILTP